MSTQYVFMMQLMIQTLSILNLLTQMDFESDTPFFHQKTSTNLTGQLQNGKKTLITGPLCSQNSAGYLHFSMDQLTYHNNKKQQSNHLKTITHPITKNTCN